MSEVWKGIPGYEGYYQASNLGRIRSLDMTRKYVELADRDLKNAHTRASPVDN